MAAMTVELLDALNRHFVMAHSDPKKPPNLGPPLRIPRPGTKPESRSVRPRDLFRALRG